MQQYFLNQVAPEIGMVITLEKDDTHHLFTVMRAKLDEKVQIVFSDQTLVLATVNVDLATLTVLEFVEKSVELPLDVTIAVGLPKSDKLEFITQKATELGVYAILAFPAKWSVTKFDAKKIIKKTARLEKIAKGAAEQSKRLLIPTVKILANLQELTDQFARYDQILVAYEAAAKSGETAAFAKKLSELEKGQKILVIFGPEGGISPQEIEQLTALGATKIGLGPRIMRAETAPLYVLSAISFYTELLH
ncbi:ribosomal RNA small subunit methyltransferase E [Lactococcus hodotermopsidis]|uniref:Ribosomal RNA small subunit methyltransferase E n=1 Tax=Pseudolactococcus hodotermopsidis TaxID=2709157 RepID=A0A6A0BA78_9LACT|nr:16S rRNA (uracil(1498)-N(3))-methyltransferase [Lactococcus hodotermopsidis]GFH41543.1 ribosomal RNA small subunit methyltransferase E [Lactococcus hodotermopsidis]